MKHFHIVRFKTAGDFKDEIASHKSNIVDDRLYGIEVEEVIA